MSHGDFMLNVFCDTRRRSQICVCCVLCVVLAGCFGNRAVPDVRDTVDLPERYTTGQSIEAPNVEAWCTDFGDPQLKVLIAKAFESNLSVRVAWNRLEQSRMFAVQTNSNLYPTVDAQAQVSQQRAGIITPGGDRQRGRASIQAHCKRGVRGGSLESLGSAAGGR